MPDRALNSLMKLICILQEIEPRVAEELCRLFPVDEGIDMTPILRKSKEASRLVRPRTSRSARRREAMAPTPHIRQLRTPGRAGHNNNNHISGRYTGLCSSCLGLMNRIIELVTFWTIAAASGQGFALTRVIQLCSM